MLKGGEKHMDSISVKKAENGYIVKSKVGDDETVFVYQKKASVDKKVEELLGDLE